MNDDEIKRLWKDVDLDTIVKGAVKAEMSRVAVPVTPVVEGKDEAIEERIDEATVIDGEVDELNESYVAQVKSYPQVTEFISQKSKDAHTTLYKGYIDTLNRVSAELDTADRSDVNSMHADFRSLKLDEAYNLNAVWLHELHFANCFDPNSNVYMDSISYLKLQRQWGTFDDWQKDFIACAMGCGEGWAICGYNVFLKQYVNTMVSNHSQDVMLGLIPLIVIDCHEHSYYRDFLNNKRDYIICMMREFNWDLISDRFLKTEAIAQTLK